VPQFDAGIEAAVARRMRRPLGMHKRWAVIGHDELCTCCNGGRPLASACVPRSL
jgi:formylmethanofuran dehydrogenase subunit A